MTTNLNPYNYTEMDVGPGWRPMVKDLIAMTQNAGVTILQIKEKFGGLRFYVGKAPRAVHDAIHDAEMESFKTCEFCGKPGTQTNSGGWWVKTLCTTCDKDRREQIAMRQG